MAQTFPGTESTTSPTSSSDTEIDTSTAKDEDDDGIIDSSSDVREVINEGDSKEDDNIEEDG